MEVKIVVSDQEVQALLGTVEKPSTAAYLELHKGLGAVQLASANKNFEKESFDGVPWPELAASTQKAPWPGRTKRGKRGKGGKASGRRRGTENILRPLGGGDMMLRIHVAATSQRAEVFCGTGWAWVHNFGARLRRMRMPRRMFMGITEADAAEHKAFMMSWLEELMAK